MHRQGREGHLLTKTARDEPLVGFGIRVPHYDVLLERGPPVRLVEALTENFLGRGGRPRAVLERARRDAHVVLHGVGLGIGGVDPLDLEYLRAVRALAQEIGARVVSDHLCFAGFGGHAAHDLWPLPYTEEAIEHVVARVRAAQDVLGRRLHLENVSSYVAWRASELPEWVFLDEIAERADCGILLDVNNVFVSARNHAFDPRDYLAGIPHARVGQIHLAGHSDRGTHLFDDHGAEVADPVWELYRQALALCGPVPTILERDEDVPPIEALVAEAARAESIARSVVSP